MYTSKTFFPKYKPELVGIGIAVVASVLYLSVFGVGPKVVTSVIGTFAVLLPVASLWRWMKWKILILIPTVAAVDIDHFLFSSKGFFEHPETGVKILHAFHSIEMLILVLLLNAIIGRHTFKKGWSAWLFPVSKDYLSKTTYYLAWTARIILLGVGIHYFMDIFIYTFNGKWGYYDYSVIHYLLLK